MEYKEELKKLAGDIKELIKNEFPLHNDMTQGDIIEQNKKKQDEFAKIFLMILDGETFETAHCTSSKIHGSLTRVSVITFREIETKGHGEFVLSHI